MNRLKVSVITLLLVVGAACTVSPSRESQAVLAAKRNCRRMTEVCSIKKDTDGKFIVHVEGDIKYNGYGNMPYFDGDSDLAELWAGVYGYGLTVNRGYYIEDYKWGPAPPIENGGQTETGMDPSQIKKIEVKLYDIRTFKEKIDSYGNVSTPARAEKRLRKTIILLPGNAQKFAWGSRRMYSNDVRNQIKKEMAASRTITRIKGTWEPAPQFAY